MPRCSVNHSSSRSSIALHKLLLARCLDEVTINLEWLEAKHVLSNMNTKSKIFICRHSHLAASKLVLAQWGGNSLEDRFAKTKTPIMNHIDDAGAIQRLLWHNIPLLCGTIQSTFFLDPASALSNFGQSQLPPRTLRCCRRSNKQR